MKIVKPPRDTEGGIKLSASEIELIHDFRKIPIEKQELYADAIHGCAAGITLNKPALRLIPGGSA